MKSELARRRAKANREIAQLRGAIYRRSYLRSKRAINAGFYLEAIVLIESMLADRLESVLAVLVDEPVQFRTAKQGAAELLRQTDLVDALLLQQVRYWSEGRNRWVHEFAKVSDNDHLSWRDRLRDAREFAVAGFDLAARVAKETRRAKRILSSQRR